MGILICGLNGTGKSTLGRMLADRMGYEFIDNEDLFFPKTDPSYSFSSPRSEEEVIRLLEEKISENSRFIFAAVRGNYGDRLITSLDYIVLIEVPKQIAYHVSMGLPLWDYPVHKGTVLYLALEDDHRRLQERLYRMFGMEGTNDLLFSICAKQVGSGLEEQLKRFVQEHPDTKLIIIDTLQKIREAGGDKYSYANDYEVVGKLKRLADACGVCLLLVHHTRKQQADDKFDMISGTNGLSGAADGAFLLQKEKRTDDTATLDVVGRDQQDQRLYLTKDKEHLTWTLERMETELWVEPPDPVLEAVAAFITAERPSWGGTATELAAVLQVDMKPNALAMRLNVRAGKLATEYHIRYENTRTHAGRSISLTLEPPQA